jgi:predicted nucleic acid-binding protein
MNVVIDANLALKTVFDEPDAGLAQSLINEAITLRWRIVVPAIFHAGVMNAIRRRKVRERQPLAIAQASLEGILDLPIVTVDAPDLYRRALTLTERYSLSGHDALYLAVAEALDCDLWTDDRRVLHALAGREPRVRALGGYTTVVTR